MRTITVIYHREDDGSWWAESSDVVGYTALAGTFRELRRLVKEGLDWYLEGEEIDLRESYNGFGCVEVDWHRQPTLSWTGTSTNAAVTYLPGVPSVGPLVVVQEHVPGSAEYHESHKDDADEWGEPEGGEREPRRLGAVLSVRVSADENALIRQAAEAQGESLSEFLRRAVLSRARRGRRRRAS